MSDVKRDDVAMIDRTCNALHDCRGVVHALELMQPQDDENAALAGVLLRSLDGVCDTLTDVHDALADGELSFTPNN